MTIPVPRASESGRVRRGSFTSPAVNVMLFQRVGREERSGLRHAQRDEQAERRHGRQAWRDRRSGRAASRSRRSWRDAPRAFQPSNRPAAISAIERARLRDGEDVLDDLAVPMPRVFVHVRSAISRTADQLRRRQRQRVAGRQVDRRDQVVVLGDPTARARRGSARTPPPTAAIVPVWMTRNSVQP